MGDKNERLQWEIKMRWYFSASLRNLKIIFCNRLFGVIKGTNAWYFYSSTLFFLRLIISFHLDVLNFFMWLLWWNRWKNILYSSLKNFAMLLWHRQYKLYVVHCTFNQLRFVCPQFPGKVIGACQNNMLVISLLLIVYSQVWDSFWQLKAI